LVLARLFVSGDGTGNFFFLKTGRGNCRGFVGRDDYWLKRNPEKKWNCQKIPFKFFHGLHRNPENNFSRAGNFPKNIFGKIQMHTTDFLSRRDLRKNSFSKKEIFGICCSCPENFRATVLKNLRHAHNHEFFPICVKNCPEPVTNTNSQT
jgi:hypothetical protein